MNEIKVLLVDDEEEFVTTLGERLRLRGIKATTATSGEQALELFHSDLPDVVVLDLMMPGLGGLDVMKRIKEKNPQIHVILLTGRGSTIECQNGIQMGACDYLIKPINLIELIEKIQEAAKNK